MIAKTTHRENLSSLRRIRGQVKGIETMIEKEKYCIDIIIQIHAAVHALYRVGEKVLAKHLEYCVTEAFMKSRKKEKAEKIKEIMKVIKSLHDLS